MVTLAVASNVASTPRTTVLVVDDETHILRTLEALLGREYEVMTASSAESARALLRERRVDIILSDQRMANESGAELLEWARHHSPQTIRLLMTGYAELDDAVEAINRGQVYYYLLKPWRTDELFQVVHHAHEKYEMERRQDQLLDQLRRLNGELEQRVHERTHQLEEANLLLEERSRELEEANRRLKQQKKELETLAMTDPLTGLLNLRAIEKVAQSELKRHLRYKSPLALGLVDIDFFKSINTRWSHEGGNRVLVGLARILTASLREVDHLGRVGGEEFRVVAPETDLEGARTLAERIRTRVESTPIAHYDERDRVAANIQLTVSIGFAVAEAGVKTEYSTLKQIAALALVKAKESGRNRCVISSVS